MKYIRKTVVIVLIIAFFIALAICVAVVTRVKNINVKYYENTGEGYTAYEQTIENLQDLKGNSMFFLTDDDVKSCVSDSGRLNLISYKKSFPCTIEIEISERVETYCSYSDGVCYVYDDEGVFMYSTTDYEGSEEDGFVLGDTDDASPDVMIDYDINSAERSFIAESCAVFKQYFGTLRGMVKSVYREITPDRENLVFVLRSGLEIEIGECNTQLEEKIVQAYTQYSLLSDGQKTGGLISVYTDGTIKSVYIP